jgi:hypothetical protein
MVEPGKEATMHCARIMIAPLLAVAALIAPAVASAQLVVGVEVSLPPPPLPVYDQPPIPAAGYIWTPGYWEYGPDGYYWVPGTWVEPPQVGLLWTPGYWGYERDVYVLHAGYWGPQIGFYGGINYGFGYVGVGYEGGYWNNGVFAYNRTVNNFGSTQITNVYNKTVINNTTVTNVSFNGGNGGTTATPTAQELTAANERHTAATAMQTQHVQAASTNHALLASVNHGSPTIAATARPAQMTGHGVVGARDVKGATTPPAAGGATAAPTHGQGHARPAGQTPPRAAATGATTPPTAGGAAAAPAHRQEHARPAGQTPPRAAATGATTPNAKRTPAGAGGARPSQANVAATPRAPAGTAAHPTGAGTPRPAGATANVTRIGGAAARPANRPAPHPQPARNPGTQKDRHD